MTPSNGTATISGKPKTGLSLFEDDTTDNIPGVILDGMQDVDLDEGMPDIEDDWIIDDIGGGGRRNEPQVKEMGKGCLLSSGTGPEDNCPLQ